MDGASTQSESDSEGNEYEIMNKDKVKKEVIDDKADYDIFTSVMTAEAFFAKYTLSMKLVAELAGAKGMVYAAFTDRPLNDVEKADMKDYLRSL